MKVVYLAGPYSHKDPLVREIRYHKLLKAEAKLLKQGNICVISPIGMCHNLSKIYNFDAGYKYWQDRDRTLIERCDAVYVVVMDGWEDSVGVTDEIQYAKSLGMEVSFIDEA